MKRKGLGELFNLTKIEKGITGINYWAETFQTTLVAVPSFIKTIQMKQIRFVLFVMLFSFRLLAVGQMKMDSGQATGSSPVSQSLEELRKEKDSAAKSLEPISDKAIVYITRNHSGEFLIPYRLDCDSFLLAWVKAGTYAYAILDPGEHVLICTPPTGSEVRSKLSLESGKIYFVDMTYGIGIISTVVKLKMMDEGKGRKDLKNCKISKSNQYPLFPKSKEVETFPPDDK